MTLDNNNIQLSIEFQGAITDKWIEYYVTYTNNLGVSKTVSGKLVAYKTKEIIYEKSSYNEYEIIDNLVITNLDSSSHEVVVLIGNTNIGEFTLSSGEKAVYENHGFVIKGSNGLNKTENTVINIDTDNYQTYRAGESIGSHNAVVLIGNLLFKADRNNLAHQYSFVGFTLSSVSIGGMVNVVNGRTITKPSWGLTPSKYYFISDVAGVIVSEDAIPVTSGFNRIVGYSQDANTLLILEREPVITP